MNLETNLDSRLWEAVRGNVEARKFTGAILDGIHFLSDLIRERSGLEGDGVALVGAAFGGTNPKLKVNRLQTESEQNIQRGVEALLRGLYQAIRNPRSHGMSPDDERTAIAVLLFVDYLLRVVDTSKSPFSLQTFVGRVLEADFVPNERYAELLVGEIPDKKRLLVCREIFAHRDGADARKVYYFFKVILGALSADETAELCDFISEELRETEDDGTVRFVLAAFSPDFWPKLTEIARLRAEHKLVRSIEQGKYSVQKERATAGGFGTWAPRILEHFTLREELWRTVVRKLRVGDREEQDYVLKYFLPLMDSYFPAPTPILTAVVNKGLKAGDVRFKDLVESWGRAAFDSDLDFRDPTDPWVAKFAEALSKFVPALGDIVEVTKDDIPF